MDIKTSIQDKVATVRLQGRFDFSVHRSFREAFKSALDNAAVKEIQVDLGAVEYIDSSALGMLLLSRENAAAVGKTVALARAAGPVKQVLDIANFHKLFAFK